MEIAGDEARVQHVIPASSGVAQAYAIHVPGQLLEVDEVRGPAGAVEFTVIDERGARRIAIPTSRPVLVRYRVSGSVDRIPLFVSGGRAQLTVALDVEEPYLLRLNGAVASIDTDTSMPRFSRAEDGTLEAGLSSLPSFIRLSEGGPFSFARLADIVALLLTALGGGIVLRRLRAAANAAYSESQGP
ncbi:MAG: hypothetical protein OEU54_13370 [Gemmatimonadota bacterium]|nr:hypothetical protein [Gemmatimonadota bacterium]